MNPILFNGLSLVSKQILYQLITETYEMVVANTHPTVLEVIADIDLEADLKIIEALVHQVEIEEDKENFHDVIDVALSNIQNMIDSIKVELMFILREVEIHKDRYLPAYREPHFQNNLNKLVKHKKILDKRVDFFVKLLTLKKIKANIVTPHEALIDFINSDLK